MKQLSTVQRAQIVRCLCEGNSIRSTVRITGAAKNTVVKLLCEMGCACADFHHRAVRNLTLQRLRCDEIWSFVGAKAKNVTPEQEEAGWGDVWTWTAIDADTKLSVTYFVGDRGKHSAFAFMDDAASRIKGRLQITTDAHRPYLAPVGKAVGGDADYATLHKLYGASGEPETRYSPATCIGCDMKTVSGVSKKVENHGHAVALYFAYYNLCRVHQSIRVTPAIEAGLTDHVWSVEELVALLPEPVAKKRGSYKPRISD